MLKYLCILIILIPIQGIGASFPIRIEKGLIITEAVIDGKEVMVILDTGAPGLVLNQKYYTPDKSQGVQCTGINGTFECHSRQVKSWSWLGTTHKKTNALVSDLSFLEKALKREIHALIGLSVLTEYYITIDYDHNIIGLSKEIDKSAENAFSKFQYLNHLPVLQCKVNGQKKILGLDTGAEGSYLFGFSSSSYNFGLTEASPVLVIGTENKGDIKHALSMDLELMSEEEIYKAVFIVDLIDKGYFPDQAFDGILGQAFLSQFNIIIHPGKQRILLMERESEETLVSSLP